MLNNTTSAKRGGMQYAYFCVSSSTLAARVFILGILKNEDVFLDWLFFGVTL